MPHRIREFESRYKSLQTDAERLAFINETCRFGTDDLDLSEYCYNLTRRQIKIIRKSSDQSNLRHYYGNLAYYYWVIGKPVKSNEYAMKVQKLSIETVPDTNLVMSNLILAINYMALGKYDLALPKLYTAEGISKVLNDESTSGWVCYNFGILHIETGNIPDAIISWKQALRYFKKAGLLYGMARSISSLGTAYAAMGRLNLSKKHAEQALSLFQKAKHNTGISRALNDLGMIALREKKYDLAEQHLLSALNIRRSQGHTQGIATTCIDMAKLYRSKNNLPKAIEFIKLSILSSESALNNQKLARGYEMLAECYVENKSFKKAVEAFMIFNQLQKEMIGENMGNKFRQIQLKHAIETSEKEKEIEQLRNVELKAAHDLISEKNKEIVESITYAKRLQQATLPGEKVLLEHWPDSFLVYLPKAIVAGDFYWFTSVKKTPTASHEFKFLAVCDCTGHGVPGAMMSMLCMNALNRAVHDKNIVSPAEILNHCSDFLAKELNKQSNMIGFIQDGMDASLLVVDTETGEVTWSGANNPLWILSQSQGLIEMLPDRIPVGHHDVRRPFTEHKIKAQAGDCIYLFTDGLKDQFGEVLNKKFTPGRLRELITSCAGLSMEKQQKKISDTLSIWKGSMEQTDDITLIAIRLP